MFFIPEIRFFYTFPVFFRYTFFFTPFTVFFRFFFYAKTFFLGQKFGKIYFYLFYRTFFILLTRGITKKNMEYFFNWEELFFFTACFPHLLQTFFLLYDNIVFVIIKIYTSYFLWLRFF